MERARIDDAVGPAAPRDREPGNGVDDPVVQDRVDVALKLDRVQLRVEDAGAGDQDVLVPCAPDAANGRRVDRRAEEDRVRVGKVEDGIRAGGRRRIGGVEMIMQGCGSENAVAAIYVMT
jgi:hypothetical protein